jgi:hypothetical protein
MKGTGSSYGLDGVSGIGAKLEAAAQASDNPAASKALQELEEYLDSLEIRYSP